MPQRLENYEQAIALDPNYALAYTGLGNAHVLSAIYAGSPGAVELPKAQAAVSKAIEIDPTLAEAHNVLGLILLFIDHDFAATANRRDERLRGVERKHRPPCDAIAIAPVQRQ